MAAPLVCRGFGSCGGASAQVQPLSRRLILQPFLQLSEMQLPPEPGNVSPQEEERLSVTGALGGAVLQEGDGLMLHAIYTCSLRASTAIAVVG